MAPKTPKRELIERIEKLDEEQLAVLELYLEHLENAPSQHWDEIGQEERQGIEKGLRQASDGETRSHDDVMAPYRDRL